MFILKWRGSGFLAEKLAKEILVKPSAKVQVKAEEKAKRKNLNPLIFFLASPLPSPKPFRYKR